MASLRNKILFGTLAVLATACSENISVPAEFVRLYGDLRIAEREFGETSPEGRIARVQILERYGYAANRFDSIAEQIQSNSDLWEPFQESVLVYVDSIAVLAGAVTPQPKANTLPQKAKK